MQFKSLRARGHWSTAMVIVRNEFALRVTTSTYPLILRFTSYIPRYVSTAGQIVDIEQGVWRILIVSFFNSKKLHPGKKYGWEDTQEDGTCHPPGGALKDRGWMVWMISGSHQKFFFLGPVQPRFPAFPRNSTWHILNLFPFFLSWIQLEIRILIFTARVQARVCDQYYYSSRLITLSSRGVYQYLGR